jgi:hypothetical protein
MMMASFVRVTLGPREKLDTGPQRLSRVTIAKMELMVKKRTGGWRTLFTQGKAAHYLFIIEKQLKTSFFSK